jgi:hypothetical protein
MKDIRAAPILPRGRVAKWSKEQIDKLTTLELRALLANAERLKETEIAALCNELLGARPRGHPLVRRHKQAGEARRLVTRGKAFQMNGVSLRNRVWSCGGIRADGAVLLSVRAEDVQKAEDANSCLLWAPNVADSRPWSDSPGGKERLEHCRIALERGAAEGLLIYGTRRAPPEDKLPRADRVDAETVLNLRVEKRGDEYWASWTPAEKRVVVNSFE